MAKFTTYGGVMRRRRIDRPLILFVFRPSKNRSSPTIVDDPLLFLVWYSYQILKSILKCSILKNCFKISRLSEVAPGGTDHYYDTKKMIEKRSVKVSSKTE
jgi:hypothetical protein